MKKITLNSILVITSLILLGLISGNLVQGLTTIPNTAGPNKLPRNQAETLDLWLIQDTKAIVNEDTEMTFGVRSHVAGAIDVTLRLYDNDPPSVEIYQETIGMMELAEYEFTYYYNFTSTGQHPIVFTAEVDGGGENWLEYYYWDVYEDGFFVLTIAQDTTTYIGVENRMYFNVTNYYKIGKNLTLQVEIYNGTYSIIIYDNWIPLDISQIYSFDASYTFDDTGNYVVLFNVTETDADNPSWLEYCMWDVIPVVSEFYGFYILPLLIFMIIPTMYIRKRKKQ